MPRRPRRLRRALGLLAPALLLSGVLAACGGATATPSGTTPLNPDASGLDSAASITGGVGSVPDVTWKTALTADAPVLTTLTKGTGTALKTGDSALVDFWVGDGETQQSGIYNTFDPTSKGTELTIGTIPTDLASIDDLVGAFVDSELTPGITVGSRLAITVSATNMFGQNVFATDVVSKNIGNEDAMLIIVDVESTVLDGPGGTQNQPPPWAPKIVFDKNADPSGFDFTGTPPVGDALKVGVLKKGSGATVSKGQNIVVDYLGEVYQAKKSFDGSYATKNLVTRIGEGQVIKGWDQGLVGQTVGSRVLLAIPSALGYGKAGQGASIPADSDLYFVIDILAAG